MFGSQRKILALLKGGRDHTRDFSMKTGSTVKKYAPSKYEVHEYVMDTNGEWFLNGLKVDLNEELRHADFVFNAMHGEEGESGKIQKFLEVIQKPFNGSGSLGSAISLSKKISKNIFKENGIKTPHHKVVKVNIDKTELPFIAREIFNTFPMPAILKPVRGSNSFGIKIVTNYTELLNALKDWEDDEVLLEEYINGIDVSVGVIDGFRGHGRYTTLPVETPTPLDKHFGYDQKLTGDFQAYSPARLTQEEKRLLEEIAVKVHELLGMRDYSKSDFVVHPRRGIYILETNALPDIWDKSVFTASFEPLSIPYEEFMQHILGLAEDE